MPLPRQISPHGYPAIEAETEKREEKAHRLGGEHFADWRKDVDTQNDFLNVFRKSFSIRSALRAVDVDFAKYTHWKGTSLPFVIEFNAIIEEWHDDIFVSAAVRARGRRLKDEATESGFEENADGSPVYHDADTKLTTMFLKAMHPEQFNDKMDLNVSGGLNNSTRIIRVKGVAAKPSETEEEPE